jgi:hypothetical protein
MTTQKTTKQLVPGTKLDAVKTLKGSSGKPYLKFTFGTVFTTKIS